MNAPAAWLRTVRLPPPTLSDNTADVDRLAAALRKELRAEAVAIDLGLQRELPELLRREGFRVRCSLFRDRGRWMVTGIDPADRPAPALGLAVDLGTTRVALRIVDLADGRSLAESAFDNPQIAIGPDVLSRIHTAAEPEGLNQLTTLIREALNAAVADACRRAGGAAGDIRAVAVAGNTAMTHLLLGFNPRWMIREPYIPAVNRPEVLRAADLGLAAGPYARVLLFPNIGSYFGGDLIAGILFAGLHRRDETAILVDVGTNAEVVLGNRDWLIGCAGAAGPALEGGVSRMGMMAAPGVVDRVRIDPDTLRFALHTIQEKPARGICGSGVIDLAAELFRVGMIDRRGKIVPDRCGDRLRLVEGIRHIVVVPAEHSATGRELTIGQPDLDSLVRSKAAMYTILETLALTVGVELKEVATFYVAGTFGCFIDPRSAIAIGMLPDLPLARFVPLGNSSLEGAALVLTSAQALEEIDRIRDRVTYLELNVNQAFMNRFSAAKFIPHTDLARFPSAGTVGPEKNDSLKEEGLP
ncbi:MAG: ASKHA domain-containing protein [Desulfobacterales bacterium]|nr:ASKHA domain-containing protein [Desulfobacterales bacterium]